MSIEAVALWLAQQVFASMPARVLAGALGLLVLGVWLYWTAKIPGLVRDVATIKATCMRPEEFTRAMESHNRRQDVIAEGIQTVLKAVGRAREAAVLGAAYAAACVIAPSAEVQAWEWRSRPGRGGDQG